MKILPSLPQIPEGYDKSTYYTKFRRAKSDETLKKMYQRSFRDIEECEHFSPVEKKLIQIEIIRANSQREEDFDNPTRTEMTVSHAIAPIEHSGTRSDAEKALGEQLRRLSA